MNLGSTRVGSMSVRISAFVSVFVCARLFDDARGTCGAVPPESIDFG